MKTVRHNSYYKKWLCKDGMFERSEVNKFTPEYLRYVVLIIQDKTQVKPGIQKYRRDTKEFKEWQSAISIPWRQPDHNWIPLTESFFANMLKAPKEDDLVSIIENPQFVIMPLKLGDK